MKILLVNDDGFGSEGITILASTLRENGHEVCICAPSVQKSSTSHSISNCKDKYPVKIAEKEYAFDGQPADCILQGLGMGKLDFVPDVVISGINKGFNLSIDILYSGTCGAASEAASWGYKAIAISAERTDFFTDDCDLLSHFLVSHLDYFVSIINPDFYININMPHGANGKDWKTSSEVKLMHRAPNGFDSSVMANAKKAKEEGYFDTDLAICADGLISVSAILAAPGIYEKGIASLREHELKGGRT